MISSGYNCMVIMFCNIFSQIEVESGLILILKTVFATSFCHKMRPANDIKNMFDFNISLLFIINIMIL